MRMPNGVVVVFCMGERRREADLEHASDEVLESVVEFVLLLVLVDLLDVVDDVAEQKRPCGGNKEQEPNREISGEESGGRLSSPLPPAGILTKLFVLRSKEGEKHRQHFNPL